MLYSKKTKNIFKKIYIKGKKGACEYPPGIMVNMKYSENIVKYRKTAYNTLLTIKKTMIK